MNLASLFFRERSLSKLAAVYTDGELARGAVRRLRALPALNDRQIQLVVPHDRHWERKVEPEGVGILRTAIRSHLACGALGLASGAVAFGALYAAGVTAIVATPVMGFVAFVFFGTIFGLMVGGLLTLRPDHEAVVVPAREAARDGNWAVIVHPVSPEQRRLASFMLQATGGRVSTTL